MGNTSDNQLILFHCPTIEKAGNRRRTRSLPRSGDGNITSRADRIAKRNRLLTARYYYWTELERRRFDDVLKILADNEFFVEDRTISNALVAEDELLLHICNHISLHIRGYDHGRGFSVP